MSNFQPKSGDRVTQIRREATPHSHLTKKGVAAIAAMTALAGAGVVAGAKYSHGQDIPAAPRQHTTPNVWQNRINSGNELNGHDVVVGPQGDTPAQPSPTDMPDWEKKAIQINEAVHAADSHQE